MPFIRVNVAMPVSREQEQALVRDIGDAISLIPGMKAAYLMIQILDDSRLFFGGTGDCALLEVDRFGSIPAEASQKLTARLSEIVEQILGISRDRTYVKYVECPYWGCHGANFS